MPFLQLICTFVITPHWRGSGFAAQFFPKTPVSAGLGHPACELPHFIQVRPGPEQETAQAHFSSAAGRRANWN